MKVYQDDLEPSMLLTLTSDGEPVDLSGAEEIRLLGLLRNTLVIDRTATGNADGVIDAPLETLDTAAVGRLRLYARVTWPGGRPRTFAVTASLEVVPRPVPA